MRKPRPNLKGRSGIGRRRRSSFIYCRNLNTFISRACNN